MENKHYLKIFSTQSDYESQKDEVMGMPHVVLLDDTNEIIFASEIDYALEFFTIEALGEGTVGIGIPPSATSLKYRKNNESWIETSEAIQLSVVANDTIQISCVSDGFNGDCSGVFAISTPFNVKGNTMSLLYGDNFEWQTDLSGKDYAFYNLFKDCITLQNAENLILPATTLANDCYHYMFYGCTSLTTAPKLPATTLVDSCYYSMFEGCTSLTIAPELPATTLASECYRSMFYDCTSLTTAPELPATTLATSCYYYMFRGCTSLTAAPELPATTLADTCYYKMFNSTNVLPDCSNIDFTNEAVVASGGLKGLFSGTKVTDADLERILPKNDEGKYCLPATTLADGCYLGMFEGCTSLTTAPELPATTLASQCYTQMFSNCTSLTTAPELPATTLDSKCYQSMFYGCTSLVEAPQLPATTLANSCYYGMLEGCKSLTTAPQLLATTLTDSCYYCMFRGCTSLTTAPELPATTLEKLCYYSMFNECSKLNYIKMLATDISANSCLFNWVSGVASSGTFVKNAAMASLPSGSSGIPKGWTVENEGNSNLINGYEYVDLGLPSGTLWAKSNVGAESEEDYGLYFAWGSTEGATPEEVENQTFTFGTNGNAVKYIESDETITKYNSTDGKTVLDLEDDAAHVHMGGDWHMPTKEQFEELTANTISTWTTQDGVNGRLFTASNGNYLFVPAAGCAYDYGMDNLGYRGRVWTSSVSGSYGGDAIQLDLDSSYVTVEIYNRVFGLSVRGVIG